MSEVPPHFERSYSFNDFSTYTPNLQQPGNKIDQELNNVRTSVNATIDRLSEIQRDDGYLDSTSLDFNDVFTGLLPNLSLTFAAINSPVFTGSPQAPTPNQYDASSKIATTSFVKNQNYATISDLASLQSSLANYLTLGGGTISGNLIVDAGEGSSGNFESTEIYVTRNDATGTAANAYGALYNGGLSVGDATGKYAELTPDYIRFGDGSTQASAATTFTGGTLTNNLIVNSGSGSYAQVDSTEIFTQQTNAGVGQSNAYGYLYNGGIEIGDTAGKWAELTTTHLRFGDGTTQTTAATAGAFLPLTGGTMSGAISFDSVGTQNISKGSFDSGRGGYNGISLNCANLYELNWQSGYLKNVYNGSVVPINVESDLVLTKNVDGVEEEIPPYTKTTTISLDGGISYNGNNQNNDHGFALNDGGVEGSSNSDEHWHLNMNGVGTSGNGNYINWRLSPNSVGSEDFELSKNSVGGSFTDGGTYTFGLNCSGAGGYNDASTWGIGVSGAGGNNDDDIGWSVGSNGYSAQSGYDTCSLNKDGVTGYDDNTGQTWSLGINGLTFVDGTTVTTASTISGSLNAGTITEGDNTATLDPMHIAFQENGVDNNSLLNQNELRLNHDTDFFANLTSQRLYIQADTQQLTVSSSGITFPDASVQITAGATRDADGGFNIQVTNMYAGYRVVHERDDGDGLYEEIGQMNAHGFNFVSEGNPNGDWRYAFADGILIFKNGTTQTTAYSPTAGNSGLSQSGNIAHSDYPKEIQIVIGGVTYAMPARIVT